VTTWAVDDGLDLRRWMACGAIVALAHLAIGGAFALRRSDIERTDPAGAIVVVFSPVPVAPQFQQMEIPPGPEQVMSEAVPESPVEKVVEEPTPELKQASDGEIALLKPPEVQQERVQPRPPAPITSVPQAVTPERSPVARALSQRQVTPRSATAVPTWKSEIVALLERNKRYPHEAHARGEHGVVQLLFTLDRTGQLRASRILRSSGVAVLDEEALALVRRAQPFPPPPPEMPGNSLDLTVPIRFNLK
jgi:periplasmic protein TonB